jgi:hypothetical protein
MFTVHSTAGSDCGFANLCLLYTVLLGSGWLFKVENIGSQKLTSMDDQSSNGIGLNCIVEGCMHDFDTEEGEPRYPVIGKCGCTVCSNCCQVRLEQENTNLRVNWSTVRYICCPLCETDKAFEMKKLVKNKALADAIILARRQVDAAVSPRLEEDGENSRKMD